MKTTTTPRKFPLLRAVALFPVFTSALQAADQFALVTNPGWTNSSQYSWSGAWGDYDKDGFIDLFVPNTTANWTGWTNFLYRNNRDGTFTRQSSDQVGSIASDRLRSFGGYWGDVNNDGYIDLLASRLYLNQGDGSFHSIDAGDLSKPSSTSYYSGYWGGLADYDNDGCLDVFLAAADSSTGHKTNLLFHGRGDGTFRLSTNNVVATDLSSLSNDGAWGDYDNDGLPDLIVANWNVHDFFYHNDGHGQFTRMINSILEKYVGGHHAWGDYDNDGNLDLAAGNSSGITRLFRNNGAGDFVMATNLTAAAAATPAWGDYDNDGYLDLLIICGQSPPAQLRLFRNNGDGTFTRLDDVFTRPSANWMGGGWGDYDNDGFLDLFVSETSGKNSLYHNLGNTNRWIKFQLEGVVANRAAIGAKVRVKATIGGKTVWQTREVSGGNYCQNDLRPNFGLGDATNVDLVRIEWPSGNVQELTDFSPNQMLTIKELVNITPTNPSLSLNGSVTLGRTPAVTGASYQWQFDGSDLPGQTNRTLQLTNIVASQQGRYGIIVTTASQILTNYVYLQVDPTFTKITTGPLAIALGNSAGATWGDFDRDGYPDVFVSRYRVGLSTFYHNNRDGTFSPTTTLPSQTTPDVWWSPAGAADFDNDGKLDLFAPRDGKPDFFYFNNGDGTFTASQFQSATSFSAGAADYDRDGLLDLYLSNFGSVGGLFHNNGDRTFTRASSMGGTFGGSAWADYDDDGWLELFNADKGQNRAFLWHNDGTGQFKAASSFPLANALAGAWGDYDGDGQLDLCVVAFGGESYVHRNLGNGTFERAGIGQTIQGNFNSAAWVDYDNDGFLDLFLTKCPSPNALYHNNGDGTFTRVTTGSLVTDIPLGGGGTGYTANEVASYNGLWFDYDNDGFLDLYVSNGNDAGTAQTPNFLYHNNGNSNAWLKVKLIGTASNHDGVGANVRMRAKYAGQVRWQRRDISAGDVYNGNNLNAHFGLRDATNVDVVRIEWPSGAVQELSNVSANQALTVWEPPAIKATIQENGACQLTVAAEPNRSWRVQASSDLKSWQELTSVNNTTASFDYTDSASAQMTCRFYRVVGD